MSAGTLALRAALETDAKSYWRINNHPSVRAVSFATGNIPWPAHLEWFTKSLKDPSRDLFVTTLSDQIIAVSRVDLTEDWGEISVAVDPDHHGRGIGLWTIVETGKAFFQIRSGVGWIRALVRADNQASQRVFEKAGYQLISETSVHSELTREYSLTATSEPEK